jgi:glycosyltransferase involved in cell wall biosynthesis
MADETFGISIIEAQASGLPVVGVAAGAMIDRVPSDIGRLGPVDDAEAMKANILEVWATGARGMGERASHHAHQFSGQRSMEELFGRVYVDAIEARAAALADRSI